MEYCGYIKANKLTSEYIVRQDMQVIEEALTISKSDYKNKQFTINKENKSKIINVKTAFYINENGIGISKDFERNENNKYWASVSSNLSEKKIDSMLADYKSRTKLILGPRPTVYSLPIIVPTGTAKYICGCLFISSEKR